MHFTITLLKDNVVSENWLACRLSIQLLTLEDQAIHELGKTIEETLENGISVFSELF